MDSDQSCHQTGQNCQSKLAHKYLDLIRSKNKIIDRTIVEYGDLALKQYLKMIDTQHVQGVQSRDDIGEVIHQYTASLLGDQLAEKVANSFSECPVALTANHHGVDYFAQSVQGSLLFALRKMNGAESNTAVPIFSCGNIPLDNLTYPQGLLLYHTNGHSNGSVPMKMPIFSNSKRRALVSVSIPISQDMVKRVKSRIEKMVSEQELATEFAETIQHILGSCYITEDIFGLPSYSEQAVILNNRIWKRLFTNASNVPEAVTLELEEISRRLLLLDLKNPDSLAYSVFFDEPLTAAVIEKLDNGKALWNKTILEERLDLTARMDSKKDNANGCGTIFFWGINKRGRRVPLYLDANHDNKRMLRGIDDKGTVWEYEFTEASLTAALEQKIILPSVFTCFLVIAFARGVSCIGGYFQAEYLPDMQKGLASALSKFNRYREFAFQVEQVVTHQYLSGMQTVMLKKNNEEIVPAGPLEIIAAGGLTETDIQRILELTVKDAHIASLSETVTDVARSEVNGDAWHNILAADCAQLVGDKVVTKDYPELLRC